MSSASMSDTPNIDPFPGDTVYADVTKECGNCNHWAGKAYAVDIDKWTHGKCWQDHPHIVTTDHDHTCPHWTPAEIDEATGLVEHIARWNDASP